MEDPCFLPNSVLNITYILTSHRAHKRSFAIVFAAISLFNSPLNSTSSRNQCEKPLSLPAVITNIPGHQESPASSSGAASAPSSAVIAGLDRLGTYPCSCSPRFFCIFLSCLIITCTLSSTPSNKPACLDPQPPIILSYETKKSGTYSSTHTATIKIRQRYKALQLDLDGGNGYEVKRFKAMQ